MAGFMDGVKKVWGYTIGGGYADHFANSSLFPYAEFEALAEIPPAKMTEGEKARYEHLQPQIDASANGTAGTIGVLAQRGIESGANFAEEVASGAGRGLDKAIKENTTFGKILGWLSENWQLALAGVIGIAGMFSGGFIGTIATAGAALLAGNGLAEKLTGKSLLEMGSDLIGKFTGGKSVGESAQQVSVVRDVAVAKNAVKQEPTMGELAKASGINYKTNRAAQHEPKARQGFVDALVEGAKNFGGGLAERTA